MNIGITGQRGEKLACKFLESKDYRILTRNFYCRYGELDIVCENGQYLVFAEVKTRAANAIAPGRFCVPIQKQRRVIKAAMAFMQGNSFELQPRFDVIEVVVSDAKKDVEINHIENAFDGSALNGFF